MVKTNGLSHGDREGKPAVLEEEPGLALPCHLLYPVAYPHPPIWTLCIHLSLGHFPPCGSLCGRALWSRGSHSVTWTQRQTFQGSPAILGDGPRICNSFPSLRKEMTGGMFFTDTSTSANPTKAEFSNKINLLVWSVFCNFC